MEIKCTLPSKVNFCSTKIKLLYSTLLGVQGWRSGESPCLPPMCPGFDSRKIHHFPRSDPVTVYQNAILFLCKGHRSKIQNSAKGNQEERLEERNQQGHESNCAWLMFHHFFFHHQHIFEGLMQRMMSSQSFRDTNKVQNVFKGNNLHQHLISSFY